MKIKNILIPVDYSSISDRAVGYALFLAERKNASVTLLHSVVLFKDDVDDEEQLLHYEAIVKRKETNRLKKMKAHQAAGTRRGVKVKSVLLRGVSAAETILEYIQENNFDLVVMGTHGRTGISKWFLGSVAERIMRHSQVPILTIHKNYTRNHLNKILVPVDFSEFAKHAVKTAIKLGKDFNAELTFLHVIEQETHPEFYAGSLESIIKANPMLKVRIHNSLLKFTGINENKAKYVIKEGRAHKEIHKYAKAKGISLILMATRGLGFWDEVLIGNNAEKVTAIAHCPVLTVRGK